MALCNVHDTPPRAAAPLRLVWPEPRLPVAMFSISQGRANDMHTHTRTSGLGVEPAPTDPQVLFAFTHAHMIRALARLPYPWNEQLLKPLTCCCVAALVEWSNSFITWLRKDGELTKSEKLLSGGHYRRSKPCIFRFLGQEGWVQHVAPLGWQRCGDRDGCWQPSFR
jgi:hypothetical protein